MIVLVRHVGNLSFKLEIFAQSRFESKLRETYHQYVTAFVIIDAWELTSILSV